MNWNFTIAKYWIAKVAQVLTTAITTSGAITGATLASTGATTVGNALTVTAGGATITAGGLTVTAGGATITAGGLTVSAGASSFTGGVTVVDTGLTITAGGATVTAGNVVVTAGDLTVTAGAFDVTAGAATFGSTVGITGALTPTGGVVGTTPLKVYNVPPQGAIASRGTDGVSVAGTTYYSQLFLPANKSITGIGILLGTTTGTDKILAGLYDAAGNLLANSALAGATTSTADKYQELALTAPYAAVGPATYLIAIQLDGTTDGVQRIATDGVEVACGEEAGSFGTMLDPITSVATTFTTAKGPIGYVY